MCANKNLDRIDVREFFSLLDGKVDERKIQRIAATMADSISKGGIRRVIEGSAIPLSRLAMLRKELRGSRHSLISA